MRGLWRGWYAISCILALVLAIPISRKDKAYLRAKLSSLESLDVEDIPEDTFEEIEDYETLRPIPPPKKNRLVAKPLALEPDAEMLPVHYKGVKPPGVDHMEMIFQDPASLGSHQLTKTANQIFKKEADDSGKKKSIQGKKILSKEIKIDQDKYKNSRKRDSQREEKNGPIEERKWKNRVEKEDEGQGENYYGEFEDSRARRIIYDEPRELEEASAEHEDQVRLGGFYTSFNLSEEDGSNGDERRHGGRL